MKRYNLNSPNHQTVLLLTDATSDACVTLQNNAVQALKDARIGFETAHLHDQSTWPDLGDISCVFLASDSLNAVSKLGAHALSEFVQNGGGLAALLRSGPSELDALLGVHHHHYLCHTGGTQSGGLAFPGDALPMFHGLRLAPEQMIGHADFGQAPSPEAQVFATTYHGKPVAWMMQHGLGRSVYWSTTFLAERQARGLIIQTLELVQQMSLVPMANAGVVQIDDFPAPLDMPWPDVLSSETRANTMRGFVKDVWYPDVATLAKRYDIGLSLYAMFYYGKLDAEPGTATSEPDIALQNCIQRVARDQTVELGLHGYNHFSLCKDVWQDTTAMAGSLEKAAQAWQRYDCGAMPTSYVPPNNRIDAIGMSALSEALPSIKIVCGSVFGRFEDGGCREFGPEPWAPDLFALPRVTSGHECTEQVKFYGASWLATLGVWTHFLHADDVCDVPPAETPKDGRRNPSSRPWRSTSERSGLFEELAKIFSFFRAHVPWLTFLKTTDAAKKVAAHLESHWVVQTQGDTLRIEGPSGGMARVRVNGDPKTMRLRGTGCTLSHRKRGTDYLSGIVTMDAPTAEIRIMRRKAWFTRRRKRKALALEA